MNWRTNLINTYVANNNYSIQRHLTSLTSFKFQWKFNDLFESSCSSHLFHYIISSFHPIYIIFIRLLHFFCYCCCCHTITLYRGLITHVNITVIWFFIILNETKGNKWKKKNVKRLWVLIKYTVAYVRDVRFLLFTGKYGFNCVLQNGNCSSSAG